MQTHRSKRSATESDSPPAETDATADDDNGWLSAALAHRRAQTVAAVLTGLCGVVALISATGKLTNQAAVVELLNQVEVHGLLRDLLPFIQIAGGLGALGSLIRFARLGVAALAGLALYFTMMHENPAADARRPHHDQAAGNGPAGQTLAPAGIREDRR